MVLTSIHFSSFPSAHTYLGKGHYYFLFTDSLLFAVDNVASKEDLQLCILCSAAEKKKVKLQ